MELLNKSYKNINPDNIPALTLAYLGDAVYELCVRDWLIAHGVEKVAALHEAAIPLVSASGQSALWEKLEHMLSDEDIAVMKRGRNAKSPHSRPSVAIGEYRRATGVECLIGYWYIKGEEAKIAQLIELLFEEDE